MNENENGAKTIILLHGWGGTAHSWQPIAQHLIQEGLQSLSVQFPGFDLPQPDVPWGIPEYAKFVLNKLEQMRLPPPYRFVGHSFGGRVSIYIASTHPELVDTLILTDSAGVENRNTPKLVLVRVLSKIFKALDTLHFVSPFSKMLRRTLWKFTASPDYSKANPMMREILKRVVDLNLTPYLSSISARVLIMWGDMDKVTTLDEAKTLNRGIRNSKLILIKGAGHNAHLTNTQEWLNHVIPFLTN